MSELHRKLHEIMTLGNSDIFMKFEDLPQYTLDSYDRLIEHMKSVTPQGEWISVDKFTPVEHCYVHAYCNDVVNGWVELLRVYVCPEYGNYSFTDMDGEDAPAVVTHIQIVNEPNPPEAK